MDVQLPPLAEGADSGTVVNILVKEGDQVQADQSLLELENQKAIAPIPSPAAGVVTKIHVQSGDVVSVGQVLVSLNSEGGAESSAPAQTETSAPAAPTQVAPVAPAVSTGPTELYASPTGASPPAAPSVRRVARELGLDLRKVPGSGRGGRIVLGDLQRYVQSLEQAASAGTGSTPAEAPVDFDQWGPNHREAFSPLRQTVSERMVQSWSTIPHVTQFEEADITKVLALKKQYQDAYKEKGVALTVTTFVLHVLAKALVEFPKFNASLDLLNKEIVYKDYVHFGIAVDTDAGLMVPVVRDAHAMDMTGLAGSVVDVAEKARTRKISVEELTGASFTVSNQGGIGGAHFTPIINKPQVAILGIGQGKRKPAFVGDAVEARIFLPLALSYDHRLIDGADAARFIKFFVEALEDFEEEDVKI